MVADFPSKVVPFSSRASAGIATRVARMMREVRIQDLRKLRQEFLTISSSILTRTTSWKTDIVQEPRHGDVHPKPFCLSNLMGSHYLGKSRKTIPQALTALIS